MLHVAINRSCRTNKAGIEVECQSALPLGHFEAISALAHGLGFESLLEACPSTSGSATLNWFNDNPLGTELGLVSADELCAALGWQLEQQPRIEQQLAVTHLGLEHNPDALARFELASSGVTGTHNHLAQFGYSRDKELGHEQIEYGMLVTRAGRPIAVCLFPEIRPIRHLSSRAPA